MSRIDEIREFLSKSMVSPSGSGVTAFRYVDDVRHLLSELDRVTRERDLLVDEVVFLSGGKCLSCEHEDHSEWCEHCADGSEWKMCRFWE